MKTKNVTEKNMKICLVGSSGGHLTHLYMLKPFWKDKNRFWVTFDKEDARSLLEGEKVYPCYFPTNRSIKALIKNTKIAWDVLHKEKPDLIISCGAAVAVPFFYIGKMMGAKLVYGFNLKTSFDRKQILKDQKLSAMYARLGADIEKVSKEEYGRGKKKQY